MTFYYKKIFKIDIWKKQIFVPFSKIIRNGVSKFPGNLASNMVLFTISFCQIIINSLKTIAKTQ